MRIKKFVGIILLQVILIASLCMAVVDDDQVKVRGASNWDIYAPETNFLNQNPDPAEPGNYVEIRIKVENIGIKPAKDMNFEIIPEYPFSLDPGTSSTVVLGDANSKQVGENAYVLYWKLRVANDAVEGNNKLEMRYSMDKGNTWVKLNDYYIRIQTHDSIISIESASTDPETVSPGKKFKLDIKIKNLADSLLTDVTTTLNLIYASGTTMVELPFTPIGSSNSKVLKNINPGEEDTLSFNLISDIDAESGIYKIPLEIKYSDELAKNYTVRGIVGVAVGIKPEIFVSLDEDNIVADTSVDITVKFVNKGKEDIKFLFVSLGDVEGMEIMSSKQVYIGNIDSDDYETEDFKVEVDNCDASYKIPVSVEYQDTSNNKYKEEYKLDLEICSDSGNGANSTNKNQTIGIIIIVVIVIASLILYRSFRRKKN